jgi:hypothetical protein
MNWWDMGKIILTAILTALASLLAFKYKFIPEFRTTKRAEFLEKQLSELYGPLKLLIRKVRILSENRVNELQTFHKYAKPEVPKHDEQHARLIEKHNQELRLIILPAYEEMETLLSTKVHLAEPDIIEGFDPFYRFLKIWQDHLAKPIAERLPALAAIEFGDEHKEPRDYFVLIEQQFERKLKEYRSMFFHTQSNQGCIRKWIVKKGQN